MKKFSLLLTASLALALPVFGEEAWPPALPSFASAAFVPRSPEGILLDAQVLAPGLAMLSSNIAGLSGEASLADAWRSGREDVRLIERAGAWSLADASGGTLTLTPALGAALKRMNQYFGLTAPTLAQPVETKDLRAAMLSPEGVAAVRELFADAIAARLTAGGKTMIPELGGEATLDSGVRFHRVADPLRPLLRELLLRREDPAALARLYDEQPEKMARLDDQEILKKHLKKRAQWDAEGKITKERRDETLRLAVDEVLVLAAGKYSGNHQTQLETIIGDEWSGRYVANWHIHPPSVGAGGWKEASIPSEADYEAADKLDRQLVIVFFPDGFDVYDLSAGQPLLSADAAISYRSAEWRSYFQDIHDKL